MMDRKETIKEIRNALKRRSGKAWSVTGGKGTAWGWINIDSPPARRTCHAVKKAGAVTDNPEDYEEKDTGELGGNMTIGDRQELAVLLGKESVHCQGESIPSSRDYYAEYIDRANGREPKNVGRPYWD